MFGPMNPQNISALPGSAYLEIELVKMERHLTIAAGNGSP